MGPHGRPKRSIAVIRQSMVCRPSSRSTIRWSKYNNSRRNRLGRPLGSFREISASCYNSRRVPNIGVAFSPAYRLPSNPSAKSTLWCLLSLSSRLDPLRSATMILTKRASMTDSNSVESGDAITNADEAFLASLGYKQEFKRQFSKFELFGVAFSIIGVLPSIASVLVFALPNGGPVALVWGVRIIYIFSLKSFGNMCSL